MKTRTVCISGAFLALLAAPTAQAADDALPMRLPAISSISRAAKAQPSSWLVGARPAAATTRIAHAHGARRLRQDTAFRLPAARARAFAADLRRAGMLTYAEPNVGLRRASAVDSNPFGYARGLVVDPGLAPPPPGKAALAIIDDRVDTSLPDLAHVRQVNPGPVLGGHGTMVASAAAAQLNGSGVVGVFPGAPVLSIGLPPEIEITCGDAADAILRAAQLGARVINLSFGGPGNCTTMFIAVQAAYGLGSLVVASAGNEFAEGNPVIYPAAYPHVLSVAAIGPDGKATEFSSENAAIDVAAPGVDVPLAVPLAFDTEDRDPNGVLMPPDGQTAASGTSFSSPIVAGAATWLATARPTLSNGQVGDVLRRSAIDLPPAGYDVGTGFGLVRMSRALTYPAPARDVLEPNDAIFLINGTVFSKADPYIWRGAKKRRLNGTVDRIEDPADIYRIRLPRHAAARIRLRPRSGNPNLFIFRGSAKSTTRRNLVRRSRHKGKRTDSVRFVNKARRARTFYVAIEVAPHSGAFDAAYRLELQRSRRR